MKQHKKQNILLLTSRFGNGHYSVAEALMEEYSDKGHTVQILDVVEIAFPKLYKTIYAAFNHIICRNGAIYNFFNSFGRKERKQTPNKRLIQAVMEFSPDQIVTTWSGCSGMLGDIFIPVTVYITDMGLHPGWVYSGAKKYLVASDDVAQKLSEYGICSTKIEVRGIPVRREFHYGMKFITPKRKLLIMGGGMGIIPWLNSVLDGLVILKEIEITVITGHNEKLYRRLVRKYPTIRVIGFTKELYRYLSEADMVLSKPGGVSIFESICVNTPFVAIYPEYKHEIENANYLLKNQIGFVIWKGEPANTRILSLMNDTEHLQICRRTMAKLQHNLYQANQNKGLEKGYKNVV